MSVISANDLKTKGVKAIEEALLLQIILINTGDYDQVY